MDEEVRKRIFKKMEEAYINVDEAMTYNELEYFMKGYEHCRNIVYDIVDDTYRYFESKKKQVQLKR